MTTKTTLIALVFGASFAASGLATSSVLADPGTEVGSQSIFSCYWGGAHPGRYQAGQSVTVANGVWYTCQSNGSWVETVLFKRPANGRLAQ